MDTDQVFTSTELLTTQEAVRLTGRHINGIRNAIADGRLLARKYGRDYMIPVFYDQDGTPYFIYKATKGRN